MIKHIKGVDTMEITSLTNAKVKQWVKYKEKKYREQDQRFLIEGEHLIQEAHQAGLIETLLVEQEKPSLYPSYETYVVTKEILKKLSDSVSGTWIMAICRMPKSTTSLGDKLILLDGVQDPGNVGTIIRTAYSFGYTSILLTPQCADVYNEKVIRSTQGALFHMPVLRGELSTLLTTIKSQGITMYATSLHEATPMQEVLVQKPLAIALGNEGSGVSDSTLSASDYRVFIEMDTFESLNVAIAGGICMYHFK